MSMKNKIGVIGFGAASIGFLNKIKFSKYDDVHVYEKSKDIYSSSLSGIRSDGKLFVSENMGGILDVPLVEQERIVDFYIKHSGLDDSLIERGSSFKDKKQYEQFYKLGFEPIKSDFYHIGTDQLAYTLRSIFDGYQKFDNLHFNFKKKVVDLNVLSKDKIEVLFSNGEKQIFNKVIISVGRSGHNLVKKIFKKYPKLILEDTKVDLGVRFELPNHVVDHLNKEMYEFKLKLKTKTGYEARIFCNNPSGEVVIEKYDGIVTVNGHSKVREKTDKTNFAILVTHQFTSPFHDPIGYGSSIGMLSNILAGGSKVILQKYGDFKLSRRTKQIGRVKPSLSEKHFILGDLNLALPRKTADSIVHFVETLDKIVPGVGYYDNLLYGIEVKFYSNVLNNEVFPNLKFIGDCSGYTRSIALATGHGYQLAKEEMEKERFLRENKVIKE